MQEAFHHFVGSNIEIKEKKQVLPGKMSEAEHAVWLKNQVTNLEDAIVTDDIEELLAYMETGHEKRLKTFLDIFHSR